MKLRSALLPLLLTPHLLGACSRVAHLQPSGRTETDRERGEVAVAEGERVKLIVDPNRWEGEAAILEKVTPIRVRIENRSRKPLRIAYDGFTLRDSSGPISPSLPPYEVKGIVTDTVQGAKASDVRISWESSLPTSEMLQRALQEGVLEEGGAIEGYLYFPPVDPNENAVELTAQFRDFGSGAEVVTLRAPFKVVSGGRL
jgi:hypothetical protein